MWLTLGPVFGNVDKWNGVGIMFDTFDNDGDGENPSIYAVTNDGTKTFQHDSDGKPDVLGHCQFDFRTTSYVGQHLRPVIFKIRYEDGTLSLHYNDNNVGGPDWHLCFAFPVSLELGFFGVSAATGGISDHHDIISFMTYRVGTKTTNQAGSQDVTSKEPRAPVLAATPTEVANRLSIIEQRRFDFASSLHERFDKIQDKLNTLETQSISTLGGLVKSLAGMIEKLEQGEKSVSVCKRDLEELHGVLSQLHTKLHSVNEQVHGTKHQADQLRQLNKMRSDILSGVIEDHSFGFWIFFALFQSFFCFVAFFLQEGARRNDK